MSLNCESDRVARPDLRNRDDINIACTAGADRLSTSELCRVEGQ